ncbi:MAG: glycosyltransferase [Patescibacteria group bacterium]
MRIAVFSDNFHPELSGIAESITTLAQELAGRGHFIHFFAPRYGERDYKKTGSPLEEISLGDNIRITRFASWHFPGPSGQSRLVIPYGFRALAVKKFQPDIIHVHLPYGTGLEGVIAAKILKRPLVGTNHTPTREFVVRYSPIHAEWFVRLNIAYVTWFYNRCDFVSSPSRFAFEEMSGFNPQTPRGVVSNPLKVHDFKPATPAEKKRLKKKFGFSDFTLLYVGRLAPEKNIDQAIRAVATLKEQIPKINLAIVGAGPARGALEKLAHDLDVANHIKFMGFLPQMDVPEAYAAADLFVMMSSAETQSIVSMQALLSGIPVVGAKSWGLTQYITPDVGRLVRVDGVPELAREVLDLYQHPAIRHKMGRNGRKMAENMSGAKIAARWEEIYTEVADKYKRIQ